MKEKETYYQRNKEKVRAYQKAYAEAHPEFKEKKRMYNKEHPISKEKRAEYYANFKSKEDWKEYKHQIYLNNRENILARYRKNEEEHGEEMREKRRKYRAENRERLILNEYERQRQREREEKGDRTSKR